jgi:DNA-binding response OmpR family regulator
MALILLVEDEESIRELVKETLGRDDSENIIWESPTGKAAQNFLKRCRPDLVILDIHLETDQASLDVCLDIVNEPKLSGLPILAISGKDDIEAISGLMQSCASSFLSKPFGPKKLEEAVNKLLDNQVGFLSRILMGAGEQQIIDGATRAMLDGSTFKILNALKAAIKKVETVLDEKLRL